MSCLWCRAENGSSISDSIPTALKIRNPDADLIADSTSAVLPTPGSPHTTRTRLCPRRTASSNRSSASRSSRRTPGQVALAWLLACSPAILPIPGTASAAHLEENVAAASLCLDDEEVLAIASAVS
jgi:aryl-alcohol dehydrogenase-like predicted oxidoreductase